MLESILPSVIHTACVSNFGYFLLKNRFKQLKDTNPTTKMLQRSAALKCFWIKFKFVDVQSLAHQHCSHMNVP